VPGCPVRQSFETGAVVTAVQDQNAGKQNEQPGKEILFDFHQQSPPFFLLAPSQGMSAPLLNALFGGVFSARLCTARRVRLQISRILMRARFMSGKTQKAGYARYIQPLDF
jgi:hypothetical protein